MPCGPRPPEMRSGSVTGFNRYVATPLLRLTDAIAALLLAADLLVVAGSVCSRTLLDAPWEWADDVARGLMVYPMGGTADGTRGDHVLLAPPFIVDNGAIDAIVERLG